MYATVQDFVIKYEEVESAELSTIDSAILSADRSKIQSALADASSEIDIILSRRYIVPILIPDRYLQHACCEIARKNLDRDREEVDRKYEHIIKRLEAIAAGLANLESDPPIQPTNPVTGGVRAVTGLVGERTAYVPDFSGGEYRWDSQQEPNL